MRKPHIPPRDAPCDFRANEAFFSCTDRRGVIQAGNAVFARVSGYAETELIGQPHNLIRHPDVPRAVFQLLWDNLLRGHPIAAYVKNLAKDGRYYWVLALVSPAEGGFLSIRFKPCSQLQPVVESLYREMGAIEAAHADEKAGMAAAAAHLQQALRKLGFADYDAFVRLSLLREELNARDTVLQREQLSLFAAVPPPGADPLAGAIHEACRAGRQAYEQLRVHYARANDLAELNRGLTAISQRILGLTADFGIVAFNVALKASKLGHEGMGIAVIAGHLNESSARIGGVVRAVTRRIDAVSDRLAGAVFNLAWSRLQFEMAVIYYHEVMGELGSEGRGLSAPQIGARLDMMQRLRAAFAETGGHARQGFEELARELSGLGAHSEELDRIMTALQVAQVGGLVEASRLSEDAAFSTIFAEVRTQIEDTKKELRTLEDIIDRLHGMAREAPIIGHAIQKAAAQLQADGRRLGELRAASETRAQPEETDTAPTPEAAEQEAAPAEALGMR